MNIRRKIESFRILWVCVFSICVVQCGPRAEEGENRQTEVAGEEAKEKPNSVNGPPANGKMEESQVDSASKCGPDPEVLKKRLAKLQAKEAAHKAIRDKGISDRAVDADDGRQAEKLRNLYAECRAEKKHKDTVCEAFVEGDPSLCAATEAGKRDAQCTEQALLAKAHRARDVAQCADIGEANGRELCRWVFGLRPKCPPKNNGLLNRACHFVKARKSVGCCNDKCRDDDVCGVVHLLYSMRSDKPDACKLIKEGLLAKSCNAYHRSDRALCGSIGGEVHPCREVAWAPRFDLNPNGGHGGYLSARVQNLFDIDGQCVLEFSSTDPAMGLVKSASFDVTSHTKAKEIRVAAGSAWSGADVRVRSVCSWADKAPQE